MILDLQVRHRFEGQRWALPARVHARPLELFVGQRLGSEALVTALRDAGYTPGPPHAGPGRFRSDGDRVEVHLRPFEYWDGPEPALHVRVGFDGGRVTSLRDAAGDEIPIARVDPPVIASIIPLAGEDRELVALGAVPQLLIDALIASEDRDFRGHFGLDFGAIARAAWANLRAGHVVQGGSTLTQQLVKNLYLDDGRTLWRKANEAVMAVLLELHYSKDEILEAYLNEVYLGQDGRRAIHGFGLASRFYFGRALDQLGPSELLTLTALVRGASYYNPRRHPDRARARRDRIAAQLVELGRLEPAALAAIRARGLGVQPRAGSTATAPAFVDLVRQQLATQYREADLRSKGLRIFTTFDPRVQAAAQTAATSRLARLERSPSVADLQAAVVVMQPATGEILAMVGDRSPDAAGFNRALEARRPIGSLIKPAVYLTALRRPDHYTLATRIEDGPVELAMPNGSVWAPANADHQWHGPVPLIQALAQSLNGATARLGLDVGVDAVVDTLMELGLTRRPPAYPSLLLGAVEMSPLEVATIYQTLANGGFHAPPRTITAVVDADGKPLERFALQVEQGVSAPAVYLIDTALQAVAREGTAGAVAARLPGIDAAGKTGTTDDLRDSWFAGFTGDLVAVAWVGRDDNAPIHLGGASAALPLWLDLMTRLEPQPLALAEPVGIEWHWVDLDAAAGTPAGCDDATRLPFLSGSRFPDRLNCGNENGGTFESVRDWFGGLFGAGDRGDP